MVRSVTTATAADVKKAWGKSLADARRDAGRSQVDVAASTGLDQKTVSNAERGIGSFESFIAVANELQVNILGRDL